MTKLFESVMLIEQTVKFVKDKLQKMGYTEEEIQKILNYDPSVPDDYTDGSKSVYQMWLQKMWNDIKDVQETITLDDFLSTMHPDLKYHHLKKKDLKIEDRDIGRFQTIEELFNTLKKYPWYDPDVYPMSKRELEKEVKEKEITKFETKDWYIIIPHTKEQQIKYGWGTDWCVSYTQARNRFDQYQESEIWMIINKENQAEKYQFYFYPKFRTWDQRYIGEFKDRANNQMHHEKVIDFFANNRDVEKVIIDYAKKNDKLKDYAIAFSPFIEYLSDEEQIELIKRNVNYFNKIQQPSEKVQLEQIKEDGEVFINYKTKREINEDFEIKQVSVNPSVIQYIDHPSEKVQLQQVENDSKENFQIYYILKKGIIPSEEVQLQQVKNNGWIIDEFLENGIIPSEKVQLQQVKNPATSLAFIISHNIIPSEDVQLQQVKENPFVINYLYRQKIEPSEQVKRQQGITEAYKLFSGDII